MDLPLEAKDWWTFVFPGGFLALQLLLLYDLIALSGVTFRLPLEHFDLIQFATSLNTGEATLFATGFLVFSVMVGFGLELLTYSLLRNETEKTLPTWIADIIKEQKLPTTAISKLSGLCNHLLGNLTGAGEGLTTAMVWVLLYNLWSKGGTKLVEDLDKSVTYWSFCRSMSVASAFGVILISWAFVKGLPILGVGSLLGVVILVLFFENQRKSVRKSYFRKVIMYSLTL